MDNARLKKNCFGNFFIVERDLYNELIFAPIPQIVIIENNFSKKLNTGDDHNEIINITDAESPAIEKGRK